MSDSRSKAAGTEAVCGLAAALFLTSCAHSDTLPEPTGEEFAEGMYSFDFESTEFTPFEPVHAYPALELPPPEVTGERPAPLETRPTVAAEGPALAAAWLWFNAYKQTFSRVDGTTCRFSPSCSRFGLDAIRQHGLYGVLMTFGRLHKNHSDQKHYPMTTPPFIDDPVANYGFTSREPSLDGFDEYDDPAHAWYQHVRAVKRLD